jgi:putative endonuclease
VTPAADRALATSRRARRAGRLGRRYEAIALAWLRLKGYRLLARRFGGRGGEIDLIMLRGRTVAFVEIKARARIEDAALAVTAQKRRLVEARMRQWLSRNPWAMQRSLRADTVFLAPWRWPRHVPDAFTLRL